MLNSTLLLRIIIFTIFKSYTTNHTYCFVRFLSIPMPKFTPGAFPAQKDSYVCMYVQDGGAFTLPSMFQGLNVETQCWGDGADIFSVKLLEDGRLPSVVQASARTRLKNKLPHTRLSNNLSS